MFKLIIPVARILSCALFCVALVFNCPAQKRAASNFAPSMSATLTDIFPDPNGDGRAARGEEITYVATALNSGTTDATNVSYTNTLDAHTTLVADSVRLVPDFSRSLLRCRFDTANGGSGTCDIFGTQSNSIVYSNFDAIIGTQGVYSYLTASNIGYNAATGVFQFDMQVQNLLPNSIGTFDRTTLDPAGVRLFMYHAPQVVAGSGAVTAANADGTGVFTAADQPYFQYNQILHQNETSAPKTLRFNVPNTVSTFDVDFLVAAKYPPGMVINEVMANPAGTAIDATGEWFEIRNIGSLPINLRGFKINDFTGARPNLVAQPSHTIAADLIVPAQGYVVLGVTTNTTLNGGATVDYAYGADLSFSDVSDGVRLQTPDGRLIDEVSYGSAVSAQDGISRERRLPDFFNDSGDLDSASWGNALVTAVYGSGGRGTPKTDNSIFATLLPEFKPFDLKLETANVSGEAISGNLGAIGPGGYASVIYRATIDDPVPAGVTTVSTQGTFSGSGFASVATNDPATPTVDDATVTLLEIAPTAAQVSVSGRVSNNAGRAIARALVTLTDPQGNMRTARTNSFGYFRFENVAAGQTCIFNASAKGYSFVPQVISVNDEIAELNLTAVE